MPKGNPGVKKTELAKMHERQTKIYAGRTPEILVRLAREQTTEAIRHLVNIMSDLEQSGAVRVRAAELLLERGWGKTPQQIILSDPGSTLGMAAIPLLDRIAGIKAAARGETIDLEASQLTELPAPEKKVGEDCI
jgi:hypothetical protein